MYIYIYNFFSIISLNLFLILSFFWGAWGHTVQHWNLRNGITMVGLGRAEVSVRLDGIVFCALSFGHGHSERGFEGVSKNLDFMFFCGAVLEGPQVTKLETYDWKN